MISIKPEAVIEHEAQEALLRPLFRSAGTAHAATVFAADITGERERHLIQSGARLVEVLDLNAVVTVIADAVRIAQRLFAQSVLITKNRQPTSRPPQNLRTHARP